MENPGQLDEELWLQIWMHSSKMRYSMLRYSGPVRSLSISDVNQLLGTVEIAVPVSAPIPPAVLHEFHKAAAKHARKATLADFGLIDQRKLLKHKN